MTVWRANEPASRCRGSWPLACGGYPPYLAQGAAGHLLSIYGQDWVVRSCDEPFSVPGGKRPKRAENRRRPRVACLLHESHVRRRGFAWITSLCDARSTCSRTAGKVVPTEEDQTDVCYQ